MIRRPCVVCASTDIPKKRIYVGKKLRAVLRTCHMCYNELENERGRRRYRKDPLAARRWLKKNPGKSAEYMARYRKKNRETYLAYRRKYYENNKDRLVKLAREWRRKYRSKSPQLNFENRHKSRWMSKCSGQTKSIVARKNAMRFAKDAFIN